MGNAYTADTRISDVVHDPVFGDYGRLIFPVNHNYYSGDTLGDLHLTWYSHIDPAKTVEITSYMRTRAGAGDTIFYDIYTDEEKAADPAKGDTGLFFFKGSPGGRFAVCNAGGGFAYVGAMHDSFPHALELSKMGCNAFALIYRPGAQTACEDLARAITFIFEQAEELEVDTACYSLWGGSAGGRMAAYLGSYGAEGFGGGDLPRPGAVITQYTGHSEYTENDPPTYACVGTNDGIASWWTERRTAACPSGSGRAAPTTETRPTSICITPCGSSGTRGLNDGAVIINRRRRKRDIPAARWHGSCGFASSVTGENNGAAASKWAYTPEKGTAPHGAVPLHQTLKFN